MKVIFDFDDVIFDTKRFKVAMFHIFGKRKYENLEEHYDRTRLGGKPFSLRDFIHSVDENLSTEEKNYIYQEIIAVSEHVINHEVFDIMKRLGKDTCYIVTSGDSDFQMDKIQRSIGLDCIREIIVVPGSKKEAIEALCKKHKNEEVIFVDDKERFFNDITMEECPNLKTILFNSNGVETLEAEIQESKRVEASNEVTKSVSDQSFGMH